MSIEIRDAEARCTSLDVGDSVRLVCAAVAPAVGKPVGSIGEVTRFSASNQGTTWVWVRFADGSLVPLRGAELELVVGVPKPRVSPESASVAACA